MTTRALARDARNRALRTALQGIVFNLAAALIVGLALAFATSNSFSEFWITVTSWGFVQAIGTAVFSWLQRTYVDGRAHVLLPPDPVPPPTEDTEG